MGIEAAEEISTTEDMTEAEVEKKDKDTGDGENEKIDEDMVDLENENKDEDTGEAKHEKKDEDMGEAKHEKKDEDTGEVKNEKKDEDMEEAKKEKKEEDTGEVEVENKDKDTKEAELGKKDGDIGEAEIEKPTDNGKTENEEEEDNGKAEIDQKEDDAEVEFKKKDENGLKLIEDDNKEDLNTLDSNLKEQEENKMGEQNDNKDSGKVEEKNNEEKEVAEAQVILEGKRSRKRSIKGQVEEEAKEPISPAAFHIDRPVRERKSVERLVASIEKEPVKEFLVAKGRGTALKDIPNVAYKISRKKNEENCKMLHVILFGRRGKGTQVKSNLSQFSGFAWHENEEKQRLKMKEKLDKLVKEKLMEFCDVFDIPVLKTTAKKEDIVTKLLDFLEAPHPTSSVSLADKEKSGAIQRCSQIVKESMLESGGTAAKYSSRKKRKTEDGPKVDEKDFGSESDDELKEEGEEPERGVLGGSEDEAAGHSASMEKDLESREDSDVETKNQKSGSKISSAKTSPLKSTSKKTISGKKETSIRSSKNEPIVKRSKDKIEKAEDEEKRKSVTDGSEDADAEHSEGKGREHDSHEESEVDKTSSPVRSKTKNAVTGKKETSARSPIKSPISKRPKVNDSSDKNSAVFSRRKKPEETSSKKSSAPVKSTIKENDSKDQSGSKSAIAKDGKMKEACVPTDKELRMSICEILAEVDLNKATFLDILKQLGLHFKMDLGPRKADIKIMVKEELIKLNDDDDEDDESETEKEENPEPPVREAKLPSAKQAKSPSVKQTKSPSVKRGTTSDDEGRCRRSDGKKWRCSKEVVAGQKYCEHHLHRGRKR